MAERLSFGLLWYDGDPKKALTSKVEQAAARYQGKFGRRPNACYVPHASLERELDWQGIRVMAAPNVLPGHLWIGVADPPRRERSGVGD